MAEPRHCLFAVVVVVVVGVLVGDGGCAENVPLVGSGDCAGGPGKTCANVDLRVTTPTSAVTTRTSALTTRTSAVTTRTSATRATTTVRSTPTTASKTARAGNALDGGGGGDGAIVRYDVSGNDTGDRGAALKEIIVSIDDVAAKPAEDLVHNDTGPILPTLNVTANNNANKTKTNPAITAATNNINITTTIATTTVGVSRANVVRNSAQVVRLVPNEYCYCDLIYGSCDINCCCDTDCTNHDLKSFTSCSDHAESSGSIKSESILFDSSLFYVVVENVPSDYFYPERDAIESESQVAMSLRNRDVFTWLHGEKNSRPPALQQPLPHRTDSVYNSYDLTHKSLRWMYTGTGDNSSEIKTFGLKNRAFDSLCSVEQPVEYLTAKETNCQTFVPNLTDVCNSGSPLSFESYFGEKGVFKVVQPIYSNSQKTEKFGLVSIQATAHHRCVSTDGSPYDCRVPSKHDDADSRPSSSPSAPSTQHYRAVYSGGACRRVVHKVEYRLRHNGTGGVRAVDVHFHHRDVPDAGRPVYVGHKFSARFDRVAAAATTGATTTAPEPYERSGKPGYTIGRPLLVAARATTGRPPRPEPMGLPDPDGRGTCDRGELDTTGPPSRQPSRRRTVNFLEAVDVRCHVRIRLPTNRRRSGQSPNKRADEAVAGVSSAVSPADICHGIRNETVAVLGDFEGTLVASLGDPDVTRWTPMVVAKPPAPPSSSTSDDSSCPAVIVSMHIRVLYSYVGTFDRPRATVLGVFVNYTTTVVAIGTATVRDHHNDVSSSNNNNGNGNNTFVVAEIPIRATVVFVDLTRPPIRTFAEPPTYEFRLPEDFYYPFWSSSDSGVIRPPNLLHSSSAATTANFSRFKTEFSLLSFALIVVFSNYY